MINNFSIKGVSSVQRENPGQKKWGEWRYLENCGYIPNETFRGESHSNTKFNEYIESLFDRKISILDLGCGGGGFVGDSLRRGNFAIGLEGFYQYQKNKCYEWANFPNNFEILDIAQNFEIKDSQEKIIKFDVVTAWEVLEHLFEDEIDSFLSNVSKHTTQTSFIFMTVSFRPDIGHFTIKEFSWWKQKFLNNGFQVIENKISNDCLVRNCGDSYFLTLVKI